MINKLLSSVALLLSLQLAQAESFVFTSGNDFGWLCREPLLTMQIVKMFNRDLVHCVWNREEQPDDPRFFRRDQRFSYTDSRGKLHYLGADFEGRLVVSDHPVDWDLVRRQTFPTLRVYLFKLSNGPLEAFVVAQSRFKEHVMFPIHYQIKDFDKRVTPEDFEGALYVQSVQ